MAIAIISLIVSGLVAFVVIYRDLFRDWYFKPKLDIEFSLEEPISRETLVKRPSAEPRAFWPRLRITNNGRSMARKCEGILTEVRNRDGILNKRYDPLKLRWAIAPIEKGLEPLDIARNRVVYLNTFTTVEGEIEARFATYLEPIGIPLFSEPGHYWIRIVIYGDNFETVERGYAVHWDGKEYRRGVHMQEMNDKPSDTITWPYRGKENGTNP